jgi:hypothetical protein
MFKTSLFWIKYLDLNSKSSLQPIYQFDPNSIWRPNHFPWNISTPTQATLAFRPSTGPPGAFLLPWDTQAITVHLSALHATDGRPPALGWSWIEAPPGRLHSPALDWRLIDSPPRFNVKTDEIKTHLTDRPPPLPEPIKGAPRTAAPHLTSCCNLLHLFTPQVAPPRPPSPPLAPLHCYPVFALYYMFVQPIGMTRALLLLPHPRQAPRLYNAGELRSSKPL